MQRRYESMGAFETQRCYINARCYLCSILLSPPVHLLKDFINYGHSCLWHLLYAYLC